MQFDERKLGDFRIFAGTVESTLGDGFIAALIVVRDRPNEGGPREVFRDESLACGHRWASSDAALAYAMHKAHDVVQRFEPALAA